MLSDIIEYLQKFNSRKKALKHEDQKKIYRMEINNNFVLCVCVCMYVYFYLRCAIS